MYLGQGGRTFQSRPLGFSRYNHSYPTGQGPNVSDLQTLKQVHSNCTFGAWGNEHQADPWVQWTPCELDLGQDARIAWTSYAPILGEP